MCPACGGEIRILAFLTDPPVVKAILLHLDLPHRPPPLSPARGPPQIDFLTDPSPALDPAQPEPVPEFEFDQSLPDHAAHPRIEAVPSAAPVRVELSPRHSTQLPSLADSIAAALRTDECRFLPRLSR